MKEEWLNRWVKVIDVSEENSYLIGQTGHICPSVGTEPDEEMVKFSNGAMGLFRVEQLEFIEA